MPGDKRPEYTPNTGLLGQLVICLIVALVFVGAFGWLLV
jgi:hypothetical protein